MAFKWNAVTGQLDIIGAKILTTYSGDPNDSSEPEVTGAETGTFYQPADDPDMLWLKTSTSNTWILINTTTEQIGAPAITSVSEALAFTWMGYGQ